MELYRLSSAHGGGAAQAHADLAELTGLARAAAEKHANAALFAFAATYDSDGEIEEYPALAVSPSSSSGTEASKEQPQPSAVDAPKKKRRRVRPVAAVRSAPNDAACIKKTKPPQQAAATGAAVAAVASADQ